MSLEDFLLQVDKHIGHRGERLPRDHMMSSLNISVTYPAFSDI